MPKEDKKITKKISINAYIFRQIKQTVGSAKNSRESYSKNLMSNFGSVYAEQNAKEIYQADKTDSDRLAHELFTVVRNAIDEMIKINKNTV